MLPSLCCKYCTDTWADIHIWNWTGLGEARMPASSFGFSVQGSFLKLPTTLVVHMGRKIILVFSVGWVNLSTQIRTGLLLFGIYPRCWAASKMIPGRFLSFHLILLPRWHTSALCWLIFDRCPIWSGWPGPAQISPGRWTKKCTTGPESLNSHYIDRLGWLALGRGERIPDKGMGCVKGFKWWSGSQHDCFVAWSVWLRYMNDIWNYSICLKVHPPNCNPLLQYPIFLFKHAAVVVALLRYAGFLSAVG